jgi:CBS domain-containing protein
MERDSVSHTARSQEGAQRREAGAEPVLCPVQPTPVRKARASMLAPMATLGEVMSRDVITIEPFDTIGHAAEKMVAEGVSAIVVSDGGRLIGIVTERDLTRAVAGRVHSSEARVREWMTADPQVVSESTDPVEAVQIMLDGGFRHLPVVENERAVGIVSIRDLAEWSIRPEKSPT